MAHIKWCWECSMYCQCLHAIVTWSISVCTMKYSIQLANCTSFGTEVWNPGVSLACLLVKLLRKRLACSNSHSFWRKDYSAVGILRPHWHWSEGGHGSVAPTFLMQLCRLCVVEGYRVWLCLAARWPFHSMLSIYEIGFNWPLSWQLCCGSLGRYCSSFSPACRQDMEVQTGKHRMLIYCSLQLIHSLWVKMSPPPLHAHTTASDW